MSTETSRANFLQRTSLVVAFVLAVLASVWVMTLGGAWAYVGGLGTVAASLAFSLAANRLFRREKIRPPMRRYLLRFGVSMSAYVLLLLSAISLHRQGFAGGPLGYLIALAPALAILGCIASVGLYLAEETDEFCRETLVQSLLWGTAATLSLATVWGFLETFDKAPHVPAWAATPLFAMAMGVAQVFVARRYR